MTPKLTDNFDIILQWDNTHVRGTHRLTRTPDISTLTFKPCSISEFELHADLLLAASMNYQGPTRITFETCVYAFEVQGLATNLRAHAAGDQIEELMVGAQDFSLKLRRVTEQPGDLTTFPGCPAQAVVELQYEPFRCDPMGSLSSEIRIHLGPVCDPLGTAKIIDEVLTTLEMDCNVFPDHGPLKKPT